MLVSRRLIFINHDFFGSHRFSMACYHSGLRNLKECEGQKAEGKNLEANHLSNSFLMCC